MPRWIFAALLLAVVFALIGHTKAEDVSVQATPLLSTGSTVLGETLHYPTGGPAHVTAAIVTLAPGARTVLHRHGVPMFAYVLDGEITVDYGDRGKRTYQAGRRIHGNDGRAAFRCRRRQRAGAHPHRLYRRGRRARGCHSESDLDGLFGLDRHDGDQEKPGGCGETFQARQFW